MAEDVRKAIEKATLKACEGLRQGNVAAITAIYTEDAAILPPNSEMIRGRQAIEKFWKAAMQMGLKDAVFPILLSKSNQKDKNPPKETENISASGNIPPLAGSCIETFGTAICRHKNELCQKMKK
mgnify:CR=1 FL=1